jgi:hypothetical protein
VSLIEEALPERLEAVGAVTALVGTRIYPLRAPEGATRPFVTFQRISGIREVAFGADPGLARPRFQVTAWADTYAGAKSLATAIRQALERFRGTVLGVEILDCFVDNDEDLVDDEVRLFGVATDFFVHHREV